MRSEILRRAGSLDERSSMIDKDLKKLSRADLLELLLEQRRENEKLRAQLKRAKALLTDREIEIENAGSIAEAALKLNGVFEAAQKAADQYLENVRRLAENAGAGKAEEAAAQAVAPEETVNEEG